MALDQSPAGGRPWAAQPPCAIDALLAPRLALGPKGGR